ncbi:MAG: leucine-rich repeat domain-containing protein [Bacteroidaceae bacterium]|nr:leucine-rich repeat domain-containing protein [Bacteroidaceae bacterium]
MKKILLSLLLLVGMTSYAQSVVDSGKCGDNVTWKLYDNGSLVISGSGKMTDYSHFYYPVSTGYENSGSASEGYSDSESYSDTPWNEIKDNISTVVIESGVTSIGDNSFYNCTSLTSIAIPRGITTIGDWAFYGCSSLSSIPIPSSVVKIGELAFWGCSSLVNIIIPESVVSIGFRAFGGCSSLPVVDNIRYADTYAVEAIDKTLSTYALKDGTRFVGSEAFESSSLSSITIPESVISIGIGAFNKCYSLPVVDNIRYADTYVVEVTDRTLSSYSLKEGTRIIGSWAFADCQSLASISLPESVVSIGYEAFYGCFSLSNITIPASVKNIERCAFWGCGKLTTFSIPEGVISIEERVFCSCSSLTSVILPKSLTDIGDGAFLGCSSLTSITIPASVTSIGDLSFNGCSSLREIHCHNITPPTALEETFRDTDINSCSLYVPIGSGDLYSNAEVWKDFGNIVEENVSRVSSVEEEQGNAIYYNLLGNRVTDLQSGIYIQRTGNKSRKVFIR